MKCNLNMTLQLPNAKTSMIKDFELSGEVTPIDIVNLFDEMKEESLSYLERSKKWRGIC